MFYFQRVEMYAFQFISFNNHLLSSTMFKALVSECAIHYTKGDQVSKDIIYKEVQSKWLTHLQKNQERIWHMWYDAKTNENIPKVFSCLSPGNLTTWYKNGKSQFRENRLDKMKMNSILEELSLDTWKVVSVS